MNTIIYVSIYTNLSITILYYYSAFLAIKGIGRVVYGGKLETY